MNDGDSPGPFEPYIQAMTLADFNNWPNLPWVTEASKAQVPRADRIAPYSDWENGPSSMVAFDNGPWAYDPWFTKWCQGGHGQSPDGKRTAANVYNFSFWQYVNICYYFTHELLTIPPDLWTNTAHKNGVYCLGCLVLDSLLTQDETNDGEVLNFLQKDGVARTDVAKKMVKLHSISALWIYVPV